MDPLLKWRTEFPILDRTTYLISNSLGAMPRSVYDAMRAYADSWGERGVRAWEEGWWEMAVRVGDQIAPLIGAGPGEISLHQNVTLTQAVISPCSFRFLWSSFAAPSLSTPAPSLSELTASARTSSSTHSKPLAPFPWMRAPSAPISPSAAC